MSSFNLVRIVWVCTAVVLSGAYLAYAIWAFMVLYRTDDSTATCHDVWKFDLFSAVTALVTSILGFRLVLASKDKGASIVTVLHVVLAIWGVVIKLRLDDDDQCRRSYDSASDLLKIHAIGWISAICWCGVTLLCICVGIYQRATAKASYRPYYEHSTIDSSV